MYKLIVADLDETLLDNDHMLSARNRWAIGEALKLGVHFSPGTGRPYHTVTDLLQELGLYGKAGEYTLTFNGGVICDNASGQALTSCSIPFELADFLYRYGYERNLCMHVYTLDKIFVFNYRPEERAHIEGRMDIDVVSWPNLESLRGQEIVKMLFMDLDVSYLEACARELEPATAGYDVCYSSNRYLEVNAPAVNKGAGVKKLAELLGISLSEVITIGDNSNDLSMIKIAGLGAAVANSIPEVLEQADYCCSRTNHESAVAEVIERFVLEPAGIYYPVDSALL